MVCVGSTLRLVAFSKFYSVYKADVVHIHSSYEKSNHEMRALQLISITLDYTAHYVNDNTDLVIDHKQALIILKIRLVSCGYQDT